MINNGKYAKIEITGQKFGKLTAEKYLFSNKGAVWLCQCDCGQLCERKYSNLRRAITKGSMPSCGCKTKLNLLAKGEKRCAKCREMQSLNCFCKSSKASCGYAPRCKKCQRQWRDENKEIIINLRASYLQKHREQINKKGRERRKLDKEGESRRCKKWREANPERRRQIARDWARRNPDYRNYNAGKRRAHYIKAIPKWANLEQIKALYKKARQSGLHVDHIVPLCGKSVCGLHWEGNLQLLTPKENFSKNNRYWPHQ